MDMVALRHPRRPGRWLAARLVALLAVLAAVVLGAAGPATAGGPTSVLLVSPDRDTTASLYHSDPAYDQLESLLGGQQPKPAETDSASQYGTGPYITVTWLIHDIKVWRVDRIFVESPGGPWIATQEVMNLGGTSGPGPTADPGIGPTLPIPATWHAAAQPEKLMDMLEDLGLLESGATVPPREPADTTGFDAAPAPSTAPAAARGGDGSGWPWALPGAAAGVLLGVAGMWFAARRTMIANPREPAPRQQLLDT